MLRSPLHTQQYSGSMTKLSRAQAGKLEIRIDFDFDPSQTPLLSSFLLSSPLLSCCVIIHSHLSRPQSCCQSGHNVHVMWWGYLPTVNTRLTTDPHFPLRLINWLEFQHTYPVRQWYQPAPDTVGEDENISNIYIVGAQCEKYGPNSSSIDRTGMLSTIYVQLILIALSPWKPPATLLQISDFHIPPPPPPPPHQKWGNIPDL